MAAQVLSGVDDLDLARLIGLGPALEVDIKSLGHAGEFLVTERRERGHRRMQQEELFLHDLRLSKTNIGLSEKFCARAHDIVRQSSFASGGERWE